MGVTLEGIYTFFICLLSLFPSIHSMMWLCEPIGGTGMDDRLSYLPIATFSPPNTRSDIQRTGTPGQRLRCHMKLGWCE